MLAFRQRGLTLRSISDSVVLAAASCGLRRFESHCGNEPFWPLSGLFWLFWTSKVRAGSGQTRRGGSTLRGAWPLTPYFWKNLLFSTPTIPAEKKVSIEHTPPTVTKAVVKKQPLKPFSNLGWCNRGTGWGRQWVSGEGDKWARPWGRGGAGKHLRRAAGSVGGGGRGGTRLWWSKINLMASPLPSLQILRSQLLSHSVAH